MALKIPSNPLSISNARALRAVTPSNSDNLPDGACRGLGCLVAGNASVIAVDDTDPQTIYLTPGSVHPIRALRVRATGTAATGIVAYY